jgi:hypothetical protein
MGREDPFCQSFPDGDPHCHESKLDVDLFRFYKPSPSNVASAATSARGRRQESSARKGGTFRASHLDTRWQNGCLYALWVWRRRRHHCRLCGRCVCGSCSGKVQSAYLNVVNSLNLLVSWLDVLYRRKYEGRRPSQGGTGVWTVLRNRVSCHGRHSLDPWFVNQDGRWYDELSFRLPRVAVSTGFECRGRWACLLGLLRSLGYRPWTSTRIFIRGQRITSGRSGPRSQPPTPCTDQTSFPPQELPADPGKLQRRQSI